jgi:hypothetical protein
MNVFSQDVFSNNVLLIGVGGVFVISLAGIYYVLQSRGYIFNHDIVSPEDIEILPADNTKDSTKDNVSGGESSSLPTFGSGGSEEPSLEMTPKGNITQLKDEEEETPKPRKYKYFEDDVDSQFSDSTSRSIKSNTSIIDKVESVSEYRTALESGSISDIKVYSEKEVQTIDYNDPLINTINDNNKT